VSGTKILKIIRQNRRFLITTHIHPDCDALASQLAVALYLKRLGKKVFVVNAEAPPQRFAFLPGFHLIQTFEKARTTAYDVAVVLDCGDLDRIDRVKALIKNDQTIINIDHHLTNNLFGHINLIERKASSTAEVLFALLKKANFPLTKDIALLLYLGLMTDTGSFRYDSTTAYTHQAAGELMRFGFSISELYRRLYEEMSFEDWKLLIKLAGRFEKFCGGRVLALCVSKKITDQFSPEFDLRDKIFNILRIIQGVEVIMILTEETRQTTRVNFRAPGDRVNVAELASFFQGGGHRKASGCVIREGLSKAKKKVLAQLEKIL